MRLSSMDCIKNTAIILSLLSGLAVAANNWLYHYPGNNYFPPDTLYIAVSLILMYAGFALQLGPHSRLTTTLKELFVFFAVMSVIAFATNAAQYTPYITIDNKIVRFEKSLHINLLSIISWTVAHNTFKNVLAFIYDTLPYQMCFIPLAMIVMRSTAIHEYYFLLLFSALIGFTFYYFCPTTAPASVLHGQYFTVAQQATGLKFSQIHHHIQPTTLDGGMIALPSFHAIWAWFCLYLLRGWPIVFAILLPINLLLVLSCVLLGWHYPTDIIGSIIVIALSHGAYYCCRT